AETAVGAHPIEAVKMMDRIARTVESDDDFHEKFRDAMPKTDASTPDAVAIAAVEMSYNLGGKLIVTFTSSGNTALRVSRCRPRSPILAITPNPRALRQMMIVWGVVPHLSEDIHDTDEMVRVSTEAIHDEG